ncbi:hypothetical protein K1719_004663 [Acacia pycnantha]|nr:hypothetical protein K1719_004663 [Acacia pycnantha]
MDMLSLLPDSILYTIVSLLPFKEAARTSILCKRWVHLWRSTTNIDFNESFFVNHEDDETKRSQKLAFVKFINNFLINYQEPFIDKFSLKLSKPSEFSDTVQCCIAFAFQRGVRQLELDLSEPAWEEDDNDDKEGGDVNQVASFRLPSDIYGYYNNNGGSRSLESLKLFSCEFSLSDLMNNFVGLKDVSFGYVALNLDEVKELLFNYVGNIESLSLKKCWNLPHFDVGEDRNLNLRRLAIDRCNFQNDYIVFKAPNLRYLKYSGAVGAYDMIVDEALEEADLDFSSENYVELGDVLYKVLIDLYSVKVLTVCGYFLQAIPLGEEPFRVHMDLNLKHLIMKASLQTTEFWGISFLLESSPSLHTLTFNLASPAFIFQDYEGPVTNIDARRFWMDQTRHFKCLKTSVEVVNMKGFRGSDNEYFMLHSLVKCGKVLKKMNIYLSTQDPATKIQQHNAVLRFLHAIPKASPHLNISIC